MPFEFLASGSVEPVEDILGGGFGLSVGYLDRWHRFMFRVCYKICTVFSLR